MNNQTTQTGEFNADDDWFFSSETSETTFCGTLDYCLGFAKNWHDASEKTLEKAKKRCLLTGSYKASIWRIEFDSRGIQKAIDRMI